MPHTCYACAANNPDRIFGRDRAMARFPARFEGPPGSVNGGMAAGALACPALAAADDGGLRVRRITARLRRPVVHSRDLGVRAGAADGGVEVALLDGDEAAITGVVETATIAAVKPGIVIADVPPEHADLLQAMSHVTVPDGPPFYEETGHHPIPNCFSCGPDNAGGMRIIPRAVEDGVIASRWAPEPAFDDGAGVLVTSIIASALDCSSGICMPLDQQRELLARDEFFLLGSLDVRYLRLAPIDAPGGYRVIGRALGRDGRKFFGLSALFDDAGTIYAMAEATWIVAAITRSAAFGTPR